MNRQTAPPNTGGRSSLRLVGWRRSGRANRIRQHHAARASILVVLILLAAQAGVLRAADRNKAGAEPRNSVPEIEIADPELPNAAPEPENPAAEPQNGSADPKNAPKPFPTFDEVQRLVREHFAARSDYRFGDLIARQDVAPLYKKLAGLGWKVAEWSEIQRQLLSNRDFLVKQLRSRRGQPFMREISHMPNGYDRLDRLRNMPHGRQRIKELIRGPDGHKLIQYMTTTRGGSNLGRTLSRTKKGKNFNRPTGRLYTLDQFLARLKDSHKAEQARQQRK